MSHFTKIKTQLFCLQTIDKCLEEMGWTANFKARKARGYGSETYECSFAIDLKCGLDIGFVETDTGYDIVADWDFVERRTGLTREKFVPELQRRYAYHKVLEKVQAAGFTVVEDQQDENNRVTLRVRRWK